jgi:integrase
MGRQSGVYEDARGRWRVDRVHRGERLQGRFDTYQDAQAWLIAKCAQIDAIGPVRTRSMTLAEAATRYLLEEEAKGKVSLESETYHLAPVVECCGNLQLDQVHDGTLRTFVEKRLKEGRAHKTINLSLGSIRHILNVAARKWRVDIGGGRTAPVLEQVPLLTMLQLEGHQRVPQPITWEEQRVLLSLLPLHLSRMALFILNTGVRDDVVCNLQWDWEIRLKLDEIEVSVFEVPREHVKGRNKAFDYVVCNSVAQSTIDEMRGQHDEYVFVWRRERTSQKKLKRHETTPPMPYRPIEAMNNNGWQRARSKARLGDLHVHDLRHTVGMRLREAGVAKETRSIILWHKDASMTAHYSAAQVLEVRSALELIKEETGRENRSLRSLAKEARRTRVPSVSLRQEKTA